MKMDNKINPSKPTTSNAPEQRINMSSDEEDKYVLPSDEDDRYVLP